MKFPKLKSSETQEIKAPKMPKIKDFSLMKLKKGSKKILGFTLIIILALVIFLIISIRKKNQEASSLSETLKTGRVMRQTLNSTVENSGTVSAKDSYTVTAMVEGTVISADFEEGDVVEKDQVLYVIDPEEQETKLSNAESSLKRAQEDYDESMEDYRKALADYSGLTVKSQSQGYVKDIKIKPGDFVGSNTEIATLWDDSVMKIEIPFLSEEAKLLSSGMQCLLTISDTLEEITGTVVAVGKLDDTLSTGQIVRTVTVEVQNPGGLTDNMSATGQINGFMSSGDGTFSPSRDFSLIVSDLKSGIEVTDLLIHQGDRLQKGTPIFSISQDDYDDIIDEYEDNAEQKKSSLESAELNLTSNQKTYDNYTVKAPIAGTVITKSVNVGENVTRGTGSAITLATIYDMSEMTFEMSVDELDISNVSVGQEVSVTADAFEGEEFKGKVTKVSLEGTASNGVTTYPVTVTMDDYGGLRPGMNVDGSIILEQVEDAITIPVDALQRGSLVYVKDTPGHTEDLGSSSENSTEAAAMEANIENPVDSENKVQGNPGTMESDSRENHEMGNSDEGGYHERSGSDNSSQEESKGILDTVKAKIKAILGMGDTASKSSNVPDGYHSVKVVTGITTDDYVEIVSGDISEGDTVYVNQTTVAESTDFGMEGPGGGMGGPGGGMGGPGGPMG